MEYTSSISPKVLSDQIFVSAAILVTGYNGPPHPNPAASCHGRNGSNYGNVKGPKRECRRCMAARWASYFGGYTSSKSAKILSDQIFVSAAILVTGYNGPPQNPAASCHGRHASTYRNVKGA